ncbi:glycine reductase [Texcoconibacillus texcoconensis]|uniref:Glycine reductase n=3 Tax=Texcoconibacillus texcoconensis TaxID=1095777 RepID=A0A840QQM0_9BACI|nr:glycine reductase [Texcoconibacillus texcoconensis]
MKKAIYYINQFFGQIGGEASADYEPEIREGVLGPGLLLSNLLDPDIEVTHTIICGDNYFASNEEKAIDKILHDLEDHYFDVFVAGPAFNAGRYGFACGAICQAVQERFGVPAITSMYEENPAVPIYRDQIYIFSGGNSAAHMRKDLPVVANFMKRTMNGEEHLSAKEEGYFPRGVRLETFHKPPVISAERAVDMLLKKLNGDEYETEIPMPSLKGVPPAEPISDLSQSKIAIVTSGGIVPDGNPDGIQSASATKWGQYDISGLNELMQGEWQTIHGGFDPSAANENPNVIVPLDVLREYDREGKIGEIHNDIYTTVGTGTTEAEATRMGGEISEDLKKSGVDAVILTST